MYFTEDSFAVKASLPICLTLLIPKYPGVIILNGPPCEFGIATPFTSQATRASLYALIGTDLSTNAFIGSNCFGMSAPAEVINFAPLTTPPQSLTMADTGQPVQIKLAAAPVSHCEPLGL